MTEAYIPAVGVRAKLAYVDAHATNPPRVWDLKTIDVLIAGWRLGDGRCEPMAAGIANATRGIIYWKPSLDHDIWTRDGVTLLEAGDMLDDALASLGGVVEAVHMADAAD